MIVDDSPTMLTSMRQIIDRGGFGVKDCASGAAAVREFASGWKPDAIITDPNMPGMDGIELIQQIRKLASCRFVPILVLTTESAQGQRDRAKAAGATGWLVKPVAPEKLFEVLRQLLPR
jgi:two-component system, chemotaxis family, chemotaxis protein CheY